MSVQIHLTAKGCSLRAVRMRELKPSTRDKVLDAAGKLLSPGASMLELRTAETRKLLEYMITSVSDPTPATEKATLKDPSRWKTFKPEELETQYDELFNTRDHEALSRVVRRLVDVTDAEVDAIMGEAEEVPEG